MIESWKSVVGYDGYMVSNLGRVKSLKRNIILKQYLGMYSMVTLCKDGRTDSKTVHRLVAEAFLPNPHNYPCINHKDEDKHNNCVENLEWCSYSYNNSYNNKISKISQKMTNGKMAKPVNQFDLDHNFIRTWPSTKEIERVLGIRNTYISKCCLGYYSKTHGYIWEYAT